MNGINPIERLKTHGLTIIGLVALWAFIIWTPSVAEQKAVWHAAVILIIAAGVLFSAGGHRVLLRQRRTTAATLGLSVFFYALPIIVLWAGEILRYIVNGPSTSYTAEGNYTVPLYLDLIQELGWDIEILFFVVPMTMGTLIAVTRPASIEELRDAFWFAVPVIAVILGFSKSMDKLYDILHPYSNNFSFGVGYFAVQLVEVVIFCSLALAVAWVAMLVAYNQLDESHLGQETAAADGGSDAR